MFTGIVQYTSDVIQIEKKGLDKILYLKPMNAQNAYANGESIAVNGACLTLSNFNSHMLKMYASQETLSLTNLSCLNPSDSVNIERALSLSDRLSGHFVTGHIDTLAVLTDITQVGASKQLTFSIDQKFGHYLIPKGSIALDGISLTINQCSKEHFIVNIIPETLKRTTISNWLLGYNVNVEIDTISKHVYQYLRQTKQTSIIDKTFLIKNGFE
jgi:riboflavin synthase